MRSTSTCDNCMSEKRAHAATDVHAHVRSAAAWGWRFVDPLLPETWRPALLRPQPLLTTRFDVVDTCCRSRDQRLNADDFLIAARRFGGSLEEPAECPWQWNAGAQARLGGRILWYEPDLTLFEGLPAGETSGYIDQYECPPWESWIGWIEGQGDRPFLLAWVHPHLIASVTRGISVSVTSCIGWLDERPCAITDELRQFGVLPPAASAG